jgi:ribosomal protein S8
MSISKLFAQINYGYKLKKKIILVKKTNFHFILLKTLEKEKFILSFVNFSQYFVVNLNKNVNIKLILFSNKKQLLSYNSKKLSIIFKRNFYRNFFILTNEGIFNLTNIINKNKFSSKKSGGINFIMGISY